MAKAPRDTRAPYDQIIDHDLASFPVEQINRLIVVELRKLREALYVMIDAAKEKTDGKPGPKQSDLV